MLPYNRQIFLACTAPDAIRSGGAERNEEFKEMTTTSGVITVQANKIPWHRLRYKVGMSGHQTFRQRAVSVRNGWLSLRKDISGSILGVCLGYGRAARPRTLTNILSMIRAFCVPILCKLAGGASDEFFPVCARRAIPVMTSGQPHTPADAADFRHSPLHQTEPALCIARNRVAHAVLPAPLIAPYIPTKRPKTFATAKHFDV